MLLQKIWLKMTALWY